MIIRTNITKTVEEVGAKARYNNEVKRVLSDPQILAWILKYTVKEFQELDIAGIIACIEGKPEVSDYPVHPGHYTIPVEGINTEDSGVAVQRVTYDIRFRVKVPGVGSSGMIINVEAQNKFFEDYDLVTRGIFYCARMLSSQIRNEEIAEEYKHLQKVYSIWICMQVPLNSEYTITGYCMKRENRYGCMASVVNQKYDLMELVMVCLGRPENAKKGTELHQLLTTVLSRDMSPEEKIEVMEQKYGIATTVELKGGIADMCNLADYFVEQGIEKGMVKGIEQGIQNMLKLQVQKKLQKNKTLEQIAEELEIEIEQIRPIYYELIGRF